jgi:diguanylate cyclase (GGDEF)-like protein
VARDSDRSAHPNSNWTDVLLVGPEALVMQTQAAGLPVGHVATADSFIEAILVSGQGPQADVIIAGIGTELAHLQRAVESLRSVNPKARFVLLCAPAEEPAARRALAWGADDYEITPVTLSNVLTSGPQVSGPVSSVARSLGTSGGGNGSHQRPEINLATLPLVVQMSLFDAVLQSQQELVNRTLAIVQGYMRWPGKLVLHTSGVDGVAAGAPAGGGWMPVTRGRETLGYLEIQGAPQPLAPALAGQLQQVACWLGGWMSLARQTDQLRSLAITDELSGAYNRRYFQRFVTSLLDKARTERFRVTLLLFDIDNFKTYNDRFGHAAGDAIIRNLITLLRRCTRQRDLVARIGGDEFAVVFWDSGAPRQPGSEHPRDAVAATERFREAIATHKWEEQCKIKGCVSISGGIASFPWDADTLEALMATADAALLRAKEAGKNVIKLHGEGEKAEA